jgi:hypothetical protein
MCSFWMSVSLVNTHLVFETAQVVLFLLISKGWRVTRSSFPSSEWRGVILAMSAFYMGNSIITVLQGGVLTATGFWIASAILYGFVYLYILRNVLTQLRELATLTALLGGGGQQQLPPALTAPMRKKYFMFLCFLALVLASASIEVLAHALVADDGKIWLVLVAYEVSNLMILGTIGWVFRPREHSPFFFMVPTRLTGGPNGQQQQQQNIPFLELAQSDAADDDGATAAALIELTSLIPQAAGAAAGSNNMPQQMIVIAEPTANPAQKYRVGLR